MTVDEITALIGRARAECKTSLLVITGGEPLRQNIVPLLRILRNEMTVQIETAGTLWVPELEYQNPLLVCSPKTPKIHPEVAAICNDYKYIISAREFCADDGLPLATTQRDAGSSKRLYRPDKHGATIWVQPCDENDEIVNNANRDLCVTLCIEHGYRLSLQQHKIIGVE
jgi:organic radical activating enzyme